MAKEEPARNGYFERIIMPEINDIRDRINKLAKIINEEYFPGLGFCLILFEFYEQGTASYISNANRNDMITALRETANRLEQHSDWQPGQNN